MPGGLVFESTSTYYDQILQKWKTGTFILKEKLVQFSHEGDQLLEIPMNVISGLEKKQSCLIYAAVVISVGPDKHWFASFTNRDSVYNLIELFWREALFSKGHIANPAQPKPSSSNLGQELLNILHESQTTLVNAANALSDQGRQIEETQATVADINTDLNVAERFLKNMSSFSSMLKLTNRSGPIIAEHELAKCFKVSYTLSDNENCIWTKGTLLLNSENFSLVDENKIIKFSVCHSDVISLKVQTQWKFCITYSSDGVEKPCYVMCPKLIKLLRSLNSTSINEKITYLNESEFSIPSTYTSGSSPSGSSSDLLSSPIEGREKSRSLVNTSHLHENNDSEQLQENSNYISDEDIEELSNMLNNLQNLAVEVKKEQLEQMEKIDSLMTDVEKTELRMKADTKKIKKLL